MPRPITRRAQTDSPELGKLPCDNLAEWFQAR
jgi:hypothetical protein